MKKIWLILQREYLSRVRKKSFVISTLLAPLAMVAFIAIQVFFMGAGKDKTVIAINDQSGYFTQDMRLQDSDFQNVFFKIEQQKTEESLKSDYRELGYDGVLFVPSMSLERPREVTYFSDELLGMSRKRYVEKEMANVLRNQQIKAQGIDKQVIEKLQKVRMSVKEEVEGKEDDQVSSAIAAAVGGAMGFVMYLVIIIYGTMVMRGVVEEKTNRIVEIILSSVKPFQLMAGKIVGIGLVGLTQFGIWILLGSVIYFFAGLLLMGSFDPSAIDPEQLAEMPDIEESMLLWQEISGKVSALPVYSIVFSFLFFFFGGYIFYSALFAAVGSAIGEESSDSNSLVFPIMIPIIISFFILTAILENPNSSLAFWSSIVPFSSPIIMPARIAFGLPILSFDFFLSMLFLILGIIGTIAFAARIYRVGILMTGKKITIKEMGKWLLRG